MKNYEKAYKEALKVMESLYNVVKYLSSSDALLTRQTIEKAFSELKESEDERIRKEIISFITDRKNWFPKEETKSSWISWLEKQGEQKTEIEYIYPKFRIGDVIEPIKPNGFYRPVRVLSIEKKTKSYYCESDDKKSFSSIPIRCENEYKLVEQKPAEWNKEDEANMDAVWKACGQVYGVKYQSILGDWLKSLKPHWKPSEQNINDLEWRAVEYDGYKLCINDAFEKLSKEE